MCDIIIVEIHQRNMTIFSYVLNLKQKVVKSNKKWIINRSNMTLSAKKEVKHSYLGILLIYLLNDIINKFWVLDTFFESVHFTSFLCFYSLSFPSLS